MFKINVIQFLNYFLNTHNLINFKNSLLNSNPLNNFYPSTLTVTPTKSLKYLLKTNNDQFKRSRTKDFKLTNSFEIVIYALHI